MLLGADWDGALLSLLLKLPARWGDRPSCVPRAAQAVVTHLLSHRGRRLTLGAGQAPAPRLVALNQGSHLDAFLRLSLA